MGKLMGFFSTFAQDLIQGESIEANTPEIQSTAPRVVELETEEEVQEEVIAA